MLAATAALVLACAHSPAWAGNLAIVMDDVGYSLERAQRIIDLPGPVTLGLLPFAPDTLKIARRAHAAGNEMILHQPMEPLPSPHVRPMQGTLTLSMAPDRFNALTEAAMTAIPGIVGANNHTGSRLTQHREPMQRFMAHLARRNLFFLDSRTIGSTVAFDVAEEQQVPALRRDVFLDHFPNERAIAAAFTRALGIAHRQGHAIVIGHPHEATIRFLQARLKDLPPTVRLVRLSELVSLQRPATLARLENPEYPRRSLVR
jgi:polysaccharide deacetylase 2 family uncharacterized protein YibQ